MALETFELSSWFDFEKIAQNNLTNSMNELEAGPNIYRGHADASWKLDTTLERYSGSDIPVLSYYRAIKDIQSQLETFTNNKWDIPNTRDYDEYVKTEERIIEPSIINYMQYLRHYGYPSPLLDWTYSPFVAAYFAFRDLANTSKSVAIYEFFAPMELVLTDTYPKDKTASIQLIVNPSHRNKRHYLQQSIYSLCFRKINEDICYTSHEGSEITDVEEGIRKY